MKYTVKRLDGRDNSKEEYFVLRTDKEARFTKAAKKAMKVYLEEVAKYKWSVVIYEQNAEPNVVVNVKTKKKAKKLAQKYQEEAAVYDSFVVFMVEKIKD